MNRVAKFFIHTLKEHELEWIPKNTLKSKAEDYFDNISQELIQEGFQDLEDVVYIGNWYEREKRQTGYMFYPMTPEEIKQKEDDRAWFDSL